jgi:hypothetical protein
MNVSDKVKCVWWAPQRCASRSVAALIWDTYKFYKVVPYKNGRPTVYVPLVPLAPPEFKFTHNIGIPKGKEDYYLITNCRNPYSRVISFWLNRAKKPLLDWLTIPMEMYRNNPAVFMVDNYEIGFDIKKPNLIIRFEHIAEDALKIPFVDYNNPAIKELYEKNIINNNFRGDELRDFLKDMKKEKIVQSAEKNMRSVPPEALKELNNKESTVNIPWQSHYNEETANIVYEKFKRQFELFGYDKDSWKL